MEKILLFISFIISAAIMAIFYLKEKKMEKRFREHKNDFAKKLYEISVLKKVQENIGYSVDIKSVMEAFGEGIDNLLVLSTFSYAMVDEERIAFKTYIKEPLDNSYVKKVEDAMMNAIYEIESSARNLRIEEEISGTFSEGDISQLLSYFNVPFIVDGKLVGMITVSSKIKNIYRESEIDIMHEIVGKTTEIVEKIKSIIETEKSKLESMLTSLPNGSIMFLLSEGVFKVSFINESARNFLNIVDEPNTVRIISSFGTTIDLIQQIKNTLREKKAVVFDDVQMNNRFFKIIMSPVFMYKTNDIIGVSITMQNMTLEKEVQRIREDFTNMVVHELRAPLIAIKGASELLSTGKLSSEDTHKTFDIIKDQTKRMIEQVGEVLDVAKIQTGKFSIIKSMADFASLADSKVREFSYVVGEKGISVSLNVGESIPQFEFDKERIGQVLNNLISNSIKFTPNGGSIEIGAQREDGVLKAWVKDNGVGIPKDKQSALFSRYTQVNDVFRSLGTGLGLYVVKTIIESHGGKIWVESREGAGTTFYFTLPLINPSSVEEVFHAPNIVQNTGVVN